MQSPSEHGDPAAHAPGGAPTRVVPLDGRDRDGLQGLLQEVEQAGADDHLLRQGLQGHPGVQLGRLHPSASLSFGWNREKREVSLLNSPCEQLKLHNYMTV